jgi:hypothetical protein
VTTAQSGVCFGWSTKVEFIEWVLAAGSMSAKSDVVLLDISEKRSKTTSTDHQAPAFCSGPDFRLSMLSLVDSLCHGVGITLAVYLWWDCFRDYKLISWHAPLFTMAVSNQETYFLSYKIIYF